MPTTPARVVADPRDAIPARFAAGASRGGYSRTIVITARYEITEAGRAALRAADTEQLS